MKGREVRFPASHAAADAPLLLAPPPGACAEPRRCLAEPWRLDAAQEEGHLLHRKSLEAGLQHQLCSSSCGGRGGSGAGILQWLLCSMHHREGARVQSTCQEQQRRRNSAHMRPTAAVPWSSACLRFLLPGWLLSEALAAVCTCQQVTGGKEGRLSARLGASRAAGGAYMTPLCGRRQPHDRARGLGAQQAARRGGAAALGLLLHPDVGAGGRRAIAFPCNSAHSSHPSACLAACPAPFEPHPDTSACGSGEWRRRRPQCGQQACSSAWQRPEEEQQQPLRRRRQRRQFGSGGAPCRQAHLRAAAVLLMHSDSP